ncbi:MAG: hypothetical protein ACPKPY_09735 [Nitrososphaeraceae archaeon]
MIIFKIYHKMHPKYDNKNNQQQKQEMQIIITTTANKKISGRIQEQKMILES